MTSEDRERDEAILAEWLRQRDGEADTAWIERLHMLFKMGENLQDDPKADRIGERAWRRLVLRQGAAQRAK